MKTRTVEKTPSYFKKALSPETAYLLLTWGFFMGLAIYVIYIQGVIHALPYPKNTFLPHPDSRFGDFFGTFNQYIQTKGLGGVGYGLAYFPAMYLPIQALKFFTKDPYHALWISQSIWMVGGSAVIFHALRTKGFLISAAGTVLIIFSYPSLFTYHTANIEGWISLVLLLSVPFALSGSWDYFGLLIGVVGAFKGVPFIFLLVPWFQCKWRSALRTTIVSVGTAGFLTLAALLVLPGGALSSGLSGVEKAITAIRKSQEMYTALMVNTSAGTHYGHSFLNAVHAVWGMDVMPATTWGPIIFWLMICFAGAVLIGLKRLESPVWMKLAVIGCIGCLAPATSTDYKLLYLAPSLLAFLATTDGLLTTSILPIGLVIFAMSPKPWLYVGTDPFGNASVYMTTAALIIIPLACIAASKLERNRFSRQHNNSKRRT